MAVSMVSPSAAFAARPEGVGRVKATAKSPATTPAVSQTPVVVTSIAASAVSPSAAQSELPPSASEVAEVASRYGLSIAEVDRRLAADKTLKIAHGRFQYREPALSDVGGEAIAADPAATTLSAAAPSTADAFSLHSKPGSKRVIFLDFDGCYLSGTVWNSTYFGGAAFNAPAWDTEGGPTVFTDAERAAIIQVWQEVSEDYIGFDVDVTTQDPGDAALTRSSSTDDYYGLRVLISPWSSYIGNYGGYAYIGVFSAVGDAYKTAMVFPENLANNPKPIGEAAAHEAGHTLGLYHDGTTTGYAYYSGHGTGETGWAPIMGVGYYRTLTQWSKGEYPYANNTEDDLAVIQSGGLSYRTDDIGNTTLDAKDAGSTGSFLVDGILERNTDVDVIRFGTSGGSFSLKVDRSAVGPDLDILAELRNSSGSLVAVSNPVDALSASLNVTLSAGTYFLSVKGTGKGDLVTGYSSYGCIGRYTVTGLGTATSTNLAPVAKATASPSTGVAPLSVLFSSALSTDADGQIVAWNWNFGDGTSSTVANPSHVYSTAGTYQATLTVTDNAGLAGSASVSVVVTATNAKPVASITAAPTSGTAPLAVSFSGTGSSDSDGSIVSYAWDFGDGTTGSGATVSHTYSAGTHSAVLTVTDNAGATGSATVAITANAAATTYVLVDSIQLVTVAVKSSYQGRATVHVSTTQGVPVAGVSVSGAWSGVVTGTSVGTTDANGNAVLSSRTFRKTGTLSFRVTSLSKAGYTYDATKNVVSSAAVAAIVKR